MRSTFGGSEKMVYGGRWLSSPRMTNANMWPRWSDPGGAQNRNLSTQTRVFGPSDQICFKTTKTQRSLPVVSEALLTAANAKPLQVIMSVNTAQVRR